MQRRRALRLLPRRALPRAVRRATTVWPEPSHFRALPGRMRARRGLPLPRRALLAPRRRGPTALLLQLLQRESSVRSDSHALVPPPLRFLAPARRGTCAQRAHRLQGRGLLGAAPPFAPQDTTASRAHPPLDAPQERIVRGAFRSRPRPRACRAVLAGMVQLLRSVQQGTLRRSARAPALRDFFALRARAIPRRVCVPADSTA
jgi:hypothetical protein